MLRQAAQKKVLAAQHHSNTQLGKVHKKLLKTLSAVFMRFIYGISLHQDSLQKPKVYVPAYFRFWRI